MCWAQVGADHLHVCVCVSHVCRRACVRLAAWVCGVACCLGVWCVARAVYTEEGCRVAEGEGEG